jgi:hypothetical protein
MTATADEFIRRFLQHVLLVAAKPLPVDHAPASRLDCDTKTPPRIAPAGCPESGATVLAAPSTLGNARRNRPAEMQNPVARPLPEAALPSRPSRWAT